MIRINTLTPANPQQLVTLQYRNAIYQGGYDNNNQTLSKNGLVYFSQSKHFIGCKNFIENQMTGPSFFIYDPQNYQYGEWEKNVPNGVSVFCCKDLMVIGSYQKGVILEGSKILLILHSHNIGVILQYNLGGSWLIRQKSEIYCHEQIQRLITKCMLNANLVYLSLLKFINNSFYSNGNKIKLRYVEPGYRFGFQNGLAVYFDELERIMHFQIFQDNSREKSPAKIGHVYNINASKQVKFKNKIFQDPSKKYFDSMKNIVNEAMIKSILSGFIKDSNTLQASRRTSQNNEIAIKKISSSRKQSSRDQLSPFKGTNKNKSVVIGQSLSASSSKKEEFFKSSLKQYQYKYGSPERQKVNRYLDQINRISMLLSKPKDDIKPLNLFSSKIQTIEAVQQTKQIQPITQQPESSGLLVLKESLKDCIKQEEKQEINNNSLRKQKKRIFEPTAKSNTYYQFSPQPQKDLTHKYKIFIPKDSKIQMEVNKPDAYGNTFYNIDQIKKQKETPQDQISSPIHRLNSNAFSKELLIIKKQQQPFLSHHSQPKIINQNIENEEKAKKTLTDFQCESSRVISEDMSNLQQLTLGKSLQVNESPLKKLKKLNEIYKDNPPQVQQPKGKIYGNTPYIQRDITSQSNRYSHSRKIINSMSTKSKYNRYQNL